MLVLTFAVALAAAYLAWKAVKTLTAMSAARDAADLSHAASIREAIDASVAASDAAKAASLRAQDAAGRMGQVETQITSRLASLTASQETSERAQREQMAALRTESGLAAAGLRTEVRASVDQFREDTAKNMSTLSLQVQSQLGSFSTRITEAQKATDESLERVRAVLREQLTSLQADNATKLEEIRVTVDTKLNDTLEKRLGENFQRVANSLNAVERGLGEMKELGTGVTDLKRLMSNVKVRGVWGEYSLGALLEQFLSAGQYQHNFAARERSNERVEYAVRLPGRGEASEPVWLPIDCKFPKESYERLAHAAERGDARAVEEASRELEVAVRRCAKDIRDKYINPPRTTDWAVLFVPTEGLYAEVLRRPGLVETLQQEMRVLVQGPTTLGAFLNVIQVGFRTMAVEQKSAEVWRLLGNVRKGFGQFGDSLAAVQKKLDEASNKLEDATKRSDQMVKRLAKVELPAELPPDLAPDASGPIPNLPPVMPPVLPPVLPKRVADGGQGAQDRRVGPDGLLQFEAKMLKPPARN